MKPMKKVMYGVTDFARMRNPDDLAYFVDHTDLFRELEATASYAMFLRPRRFGKSLLCAVLQAYYDKDYSKTQESFNYNCSLQIDACADNYREVLGEERVSKVKTQSDTILAESRPNYDALCHDDGLQNFARRREDNSRSMPRIMICGRSGARRSSKRSPSSFRAINWCCAKKWYKKKWFPYGTLLRVR